MLQQQVTAFRNEASSTIHSNQLAKNQKLSAPVDDPSTYDIYITSQSPHLFDVLNQHHRQNLIRSGI